MLTLFNSSSGTSLCPGCQTIPELEDAAASARAAVETTIYCTYAISMDFKTFGVQLHFKEEKTWNFETVEHTLDKIFEWNIEQIIKNSQKALTMIDIKGESSWVPLTFGSARPVEQTKIITELFDAGGILTSVRNVLKIVENLLPFCADEELKMIIGERMKGMKQRVRRGHTRGKKRSLELFSLKL